nr:hypothetical protein WG33_0052 [uncultured bacterium]
MIPTDVAPLVEALRDGAKLALGGNFVGFYLRGSLALGDFNPVTSDVDVLVVTEQPVTEAQFAALDEFHRRLPARDNPYHRHYEVTYVDRAAIRRFRPEERVHPTIGSDWPFHRSPHRDNFTLERWTVRERGVVVVGPDPKELIDPITPEDIRDAVVSELRARVDGWAGGEPWPEWLAPRLYQAFEVETICRALYTLNVGQLPTKPQAVAWSLGALVAPWRSLVHWSQVYREDKTIDPGKIAEVASFARWAADSHGYGAAEPLL